MNNTNAFTEKEMQEAKKEVIPYHRFRRLPDHQKYELSEHYMNVLNMTSQDIVDVWGGAIKAGTLATYRNRWRKLYGEISLVKDDMDEIQSDKSGDLDYLIGGYSLKEKGGGSSKSKRDNSKLSIEIDGNYRGYEVRNRVEGVLKLIKNLNNYKVTINIYEADTK